VVPVGLKDSSSHGNSIFLLNADRSLSDMPLVVYRLCGRVNKQTCYVGASAGVVKYLVGFYAYSK
jgi:hypothetical protein